VLILKNYCYPIIILMFADILFELKYRKSVEIVMHGLVFSPCESVFFTDYRSIILMILFMIYEAQNTLILYIR